MDAVPVPVVVPVCVELGDPLSVRKGVGSPEGVPDKEAVRLDVLVRDPVFVPETVTEEEAVPVTVPVLLKDMDGLTLCDPVLVPVAVIAAVLVPVDVPAAVLLGVWLPV